MKKRREALRLPARFVRLLHLVRSGLLDFVAGILLRAFQIGLALQTAALLRGLLRLTRPIRLLTRSLWLARPLRLTLALRLARSFWLLTRSLLRLARPLRLLTRPLRLLARLVLLTARGPLHVHVLAVFTQLTFLAADTAAVQAFLVFGHGGASCHGNVVVAPIHHKLRPVVGSPCRGSRERHRRRLC